MQPENEGQRASLADPLSEPVARAAGEAATILDGILSRYGDLSLMMVQGEPSPAGRHLVWKAISGERAGDGNPCWDDGSDRTDFLWGPGWEQGQGQIRADLGRLEQLGAAILGASSDPHTGAGAEHAVLRALFRASRAQCHAIVQLGDKAAADRVGRPTVGEIQVIGGGVKIVTGQPPAITVANLPNDAEQGQLVGLLGKGGVKVWLLRNLIRTTIGQCRSVEAAYERRVEGGSVIASTAIAQPQPPGRTSKAGGGDAPEKVPWTQEDLDRAIRQYKAQRSAQYDDIKAGVDRNKKAAKRAAQEVFGRNAIATALGVKSRTMVSKSPVWLSMAEELGLTLKRRDSGSAVRQPAKPAKVGLEIAVEKKSGRAAGGAGRSPTSSAIESEERAETLRRIERFAKSGTGREQKAENKKRANELFDALQRGDMSDDEVRETIKLLSEPVE